MIAEIDGRIVGNLNFDGGQRPRTRHMGEFGLTVLKDYWGQGVGSILLKYLINWSRETGVIKKINLTVREDNKTAIKLYKKFGFKEEGFITRFFYLEGKFYNALKMGIEL